MHYLFSIGQGNNRGPLNKRKVLKMQISLRLRLDSARDRFVIDFGPEAPEGELRVEREIKVEDSPNPVILTTTQDGTIEEISFPGLAKFLQHLAGEKPEKLGKAKK